MSNLFKQPQKQDKPNRGKFYAYFLPSTQEQGIVKSWAACKNETDGVPGARFKKFSEQTAAEAWIKIWLAKEQARLERKSKKDVRVSDKLLSEKLVQVLPVVIHSRLADFAIEIYFDGACETEKKIATYGWLIKERGTIIASAGKIIGENSTNNVAEYAALLEALRELVRIKGERFGGGVMIHGDSKIICLTVAREWGWKGKRKDKWLPHKDAPHLLPYLEEIHSILANIPHEVQWIPREQNQEADDLSKKPLIEAGIIKSDSGKEKCDKCGGRMFPRKGPYGAFLGCENYPKCRNVRKLAPNS